MQISLIATCKGRKKDILRNFNSWLALDIDEVILVDWACPESTGKEIARRYKRNGKVEVVLVAPRFTGPLFHLGAARNIGARRARNEWLLFVDADTKLSPRFLESARQHVIDWSRPHADLVVAGEHCLLENSVSKLPATWTTDGVCLIRSYLFNVINGYVETPGWGGVSYDMYLRALRFGHSGCTTHCRIGYYNSLEVIHKPHTDELRCRFNAGNWQEGNRDIAYANRNRALRDRRDRSYRAQPGRAYGVFVPDMSLTAVRASKVRTVAPIEDF